MVNGKSMHCTPFRYDLLHIIISYGCGYQKSIRCDDKRWSLVMKLQ